MASTWILTLTASLLLTLLYRFYTKQNGKPLPPGPPGKPIIGNLKDLPPPRVPEYRHWLKHKDAFGLISSVNVLGQPIVLIHDKGAAFDLLEKKSRVSSNRPTTEFSSLCGYGDYVANMSYNDNFKRQRRLIHQSLGTKKMVEKFYPVQREEAGGLLIRALQEPEKLIQHFKSEAAGIILKVTYGYTAEPKTRDPLVNLIDHMMNQFLDSIALLAWIVDGIPALKHLPEWLPGMSFKTTAREWKEISVMTAEIPYAFTRQQMTGWTDQTSLVQQLVENCINSDPEQKLRYEDEKAIKFSAAALYGGGAETTISSLSGFVLAMLKFPDVQRKAQEEIDGVIGNGRLPQHEDRERLPYVDAVVKEALRWWPVTPLGIPHSVDEDIEYRGYLIPKGTILVPSIWWFLHDPEVYQDPLSFDPTRFISPRDEPDPSNVAFGFGRRICPGRHLAETSLFLTIAQLLATFNIDKALDAEGKVIEPPVESTPGIVDHPRPFAYRLAPRSAAHRELVQNVEKEYPWQQSDAENLVNKDFLRRLMKV